jgi:amino acid transporter
VFAVFESAMSTSWVKTILIICVVGQFFCGMSCMTSASRMMYAFSRDGAVPGSRLWSRVNANRIPFNAVMAVVLVSGVFFAVANLLVDLAVGLIDPRLRVRAGLSR